MSYKFGGSRGLIAPKCVPEIALSGALAGLWEAPKQMHFARIRRSG